MRSSHQADKEMRKKFLSQPAGILKTSKRGGDAGKIYGNDHDGFLVLKDYIVNLNIYIKPFPEVNVISPVNISEGEYLFDVLTGEMLDNYEHKFNLVIPVLYNHNHWCVVNLLIEGGEISKAVFWDPMLEANSPPQHEGVSYVQATINQINAHKLIQVEFEKGTQINGYSCLDYSVQHILKLLKVENEITRASSDEVLRQALIKTVIKSDAELRTLNQSPKIEEVFDDSEDEASTDTVEEAEEKTVVTKLDKIDYLHSHNEDALHALLIHSEHKGIQEQFDAVMASKLNELFKQQSVTEEKVLFQQARRHAYAALLNKFGITVNACVPVEGDKDKVSPTILKA